MLDVVAVTLDDWSALVIVIQAMHMLGTACAAWRTP